MTDITTFEDSVKARLKSIVADLIPEERWDQIVQATVKDFERVDLPKLIKEELTAQYKQAILTEFSKQEWQAQWANGNFGASEALQKMLIEAAPLILASMLGSHMQQMLDQLRYAMQNRTY